MTSRLRGRYYLALGLGFVLALAVLGGASRADELQQSAIRCASILAIALAVWPLDFRVFRDARTPAAGIALLYILLLIQLFPLPPDLWARMPGHGVYAAMANQTNSVGWRPWTLSPDLTLNALAALLPATAAGLLALTLDFRERLLLARVMVAVACISAVLGLLQFAAGDSALHLFRTTSEDSAVGLFANRNHQAAFMACALPLLAAERSIRLRQLEHNERRTIVLAGVQATILLMGLASTGSRMGILLGVVAIAAAAVIVLTTIGPRRSIRQITSRFWLATGAAVMGAFAAVSLLLMRSGVAARLASDPVDQTRIAAIQPMMSAVRAFLPFGSGFGTFQPVYQRFEPDRLLSTIYLNQAHNEPMQLAIEGGVPALALLLLFLTWWMRALVRTIRQSGSSSRRALGMAMATGTFILLLSSLVDYPLRTPLLSGFFAIACVELVRSSRRAT